ENGAGKSTLMKILAGAYTATSGEILIDGKPQTIRGPKDALAAGNVTFFIEQIAGGRPTIMRTSSGALSLSRTRLPTYCPSR
ncbi:ATP-binding cassette domain-containing protein, partial [Klebsiella pneumoniae]|uniref:ATP-binding cassette domain-containing protein n=1 Tax=Klebsiella pneumoniae TaxID=573 RepID=UPI001E290C5C